MPADNKFNPRGALGGIFILVGFFSIFCAALMLLAAGWRTYREHTIASRWIDTRAVVRNCRLDLYHPFSRDGGGTTYSLACRIAYQFDALPYENDLHTTSNRSQLVAGAINEWVAQHRSGADLIVKVNPRDPREIAAVTALPIEQFNTSGEAAVAALAFALGALVCVPLGRRMVRPK